VPSPLHRTRRFALATGLALIAPWLVPATSAAATPVANLFRTTYNYSSSLTLAQEATRYQAMVLQSTDGNLVAQLHADNPGVKIFMYMDPMDSSTTDTSAQAVCTSYTSDLASHPTWFLKNQNGTTISPSYNSNEYIMDVGNAAYQQACVARAVTLAKQYGFDGVFWDDIETNTFAFPSGIYSPEYPTATAYYDSFLSFTQYSGPQIRGQGLLSIGNICDATPTQWQALTTPMDGSEEEAFGDGGAGLAQQIPFMANKLKDVAWSEANGKYTLLHSYNTTEAGNTYSLAAMLLVAQSRSSYGTANNCYTYCETWYPEYTTAEQLGTPSGTYTTLANGVLERRFANGIVLVNATSNSIPAFSLGGGTYTGSGLTSVGSVSMAPTTGYVLLADSTTASYILSPPTNAGLPVISGTAWKGQTLTVSNGTWSGSPTPTYTYQWSRCSTSATTSCTPISGAIAASYVVQSADVGQHLEATVTATNSAGTASAASAETSLVPTPTFYLTASPTSATVRPGHSASFTIYVKALYGWAGSVSLSVHGVPTGATASFSSGTTSSSSSLTILTSRRSVGTWPMTVSGVSGSQVGSVNLSLTVKG
jgi:putative glycosyl hydrolase-like family 15 (GHL15) protein